MKCESCEKILSEEEEFHNDEGGSYCEPCYKQGWLEAALDAGIY